MMPGLTPDLTWTLSSEAESGGLLAVASKSESEPIYSHAKARPYLDTASYTAQHAGLAWYSNKPWVGEQSQQAFSGSVAPIRVAVICHGGVGQQHHRYCMFAG